jgi:hypothetical protein
MKFENSQQVADYLLRAGEGQIDKSFIHAAFAIPAGAKAAPCRAGDKMVLDKAVMTEANSPLLKHPNIGDFLGKEISIGRVLFNLVLFSCQEDTYGNSFGDAVKRKEKNDLRPKVQFRNMALQGKALESIYKEMSALMIDGLIGGEIMEQFVDNLNWIGFVLVPYLSPSLDFDTLYPSDDVKAVRDKVLKENEVTIAQNDVVDFTKRVEPQIVSQTQDLMRQKNSPGMLIYDSGANGSYGNNFKITALLRGAVAESDDPSKFSINTSSLSEGVSKEETVVAGDIAVQGSIGRAIGTRKGGYLVKQFYAGFQSLVADKDGTDCKTPLTLPVVITEKNYEDYLYRNAVVGGKIVQLNRTNKGDFVGKLVQMRSPFYCQSRKICHTCLGDMMRRLGIKNVGLTTANIGSTLLNGSLKAFHQLTVKAEKYDLADFMSASK